MIILTGVIFNSHVNMNMTWQSVREWTSSEWPFAVSPVLSNFPLGQKLNAAGLTGLQIISKSYDTPIVDRFHAPSRLLVIHYNICLCSDCLVSSLIFSSLHLTSLLFTLRLTPTYSLHSYLPCLFNHTPPHKHHFLHTILNPHISHHHLHTMPHPAVSYWYHQ